MRKHLRDHQAEGHKVPEDTNEDMLVDRAENDAEAN
jgi:hypothetical protein